MHQAVNRIVRTITSDVHGGSKGGDRASPMWRDTKVYVG